MICVYVELSDIRSCFLSLFASMAMSDHGCCRVDIDGYFMDAGFDI